MTPREELSLRDELDSGVAPRRELEIRESIDSGNILNIPGAGGQSFDIAKDKGLRELQIFMGRDPDVSQKGVKDFSFRAGLSRMDTPQERESFLTEKVGKEGFSTDRFGNLVLTPEGASQLGQETDRPVIIDEPGLSKGDVADLRGVAPVIAGGIAGGMAATGVGIVPAAALTGLVAAGFKGADEALDALRGENLQTGTEVGKDLATEGALAATGEGVFRGILAPIGRKILAPNVSKLRPGAEELTKESLDIGVRPKLGNLINRPILTRLSGMVDSIFGDLNASRNAKAIGVRIKSLRNSFGKHMDDALDLGTRIKTDIGQARKSFGQAANARFGLVDELARGRKLISTAGIKKQADDLLESLPKNVEGKNILTSGERLKDLTDIQSLPDSITVEQLQAIRNTLFDRMEFGSVTPGVGSREARLLVKSVEGTVDDTINGLSKSLDPDDILGAQALDALKDARAFYKEGIRKFDNATVKRIAKDPSIAGSLDPERVIDLLFKKGSVSPLKRVLSILPKKTGEDIRSAAMSRILDNATKESGDALTGKLFDGTNLIRTLDSYGTPTLDAMFGEAKRKELQILGRVIQAASKPPGSKASGGLVAASIAVRPFKNIGRLVKLRAFAAIMNSENGVKWLTQGIRAPNTRAGAAALSRLTVQVERASEGLTLGKKTTGLEKQTQSIDSQPTQ